MDPEPSTNSDGHVSSLDASDPTKHLTPLQHKGFLLAKMDAPVVHNTIHSYYPNPHLLVLLRQQDLSFAHNSPIKDRGKKSVFEASNDLYDGTIDVITWSKSWGWMTVF